MTLALRAAFAVLVVAVVASGCSASTGGPPSDAHATTDASRATPSSPAAYDPGRWAPVRGLGRCGPQPPRLAGVRFESLRLRTPGRVLPAVALGRGRTVAVLVHQTDGGGLCGWLSFAARIAAVPGQAALAFDLCGYGDATCSSGNTSLARQVEEVRLAIDEAVRRFHPRRLVLVGASMGGSLAVLTAARDHRPDAVVDLSGPDEWHDAAVHEHAPAVRSPLLVAMADDEGPPEVATARATAESAVEGHFLGAASGHGYALLEADDGRPTPLSDVVLRWIAGDIG